MKIKLRIIRKKGPIGLMKTIMKAMFDIMNIYGESTTENEYGATT